MQRRNLQYVNVVLICNKCGNYWHKDKTCLQAINEELGEFSNNNETKLCMNCKTIVTKNEGCPHITCSLCKYQWCWNCGEEYLPGHPENCRKTLVRIDTTARRRLKRSREKIRNIISRFFGIIGWVVLVTAIPTITIVVVTLI